jgi:hypothetical protein
VNAGAEKYVSEPSVTGAGAGFRPVIAPEKLSMESVKLPLIPVTVDAPNGPVFETWKVPEATIPLPLTEKL